MGGVRTLYLRLYSVMLTLNLFSDDDPTDISQKQNRNESSLPGPFVGPNPFLDIPQNIVAVEYKKGYVMRKCCVDPNNKKSKFHRPSYLVGGYTGSVL